MHTAPSFLRCAVGAVVYWTGPCVPPALGRVRLNRFHSQFLVLRNGALRVVRCYRERCWCNLGAARQIHPPTVDGDGG